MKKTVPEEVLEILAKAKERGIGARKLARAAGFDSETVRRWRLGISNPVHSNFTMFKETFERLCPAPKKGDK